MKTWTNGWITSRRMHEEATHNCLLGCRDCPDSLPHYLQCSHLYALVKFMLHDTELANSDPSVRFALSNPSEIQMKVVCCIFSAYHALKSKVRAREIIPSSETDVTTFHGAGSALRHAWSTFAQHFGAAAGEFSIGHRSFSLPRFLILLSSVCPH